MVESMKRAQHRRNTIDAVKIFIRANPELKGDQLTINVMSRLNVSRRTALEYIYVAAAEMGIPIEEIPTWITSDVERAQTEEKEMKEGRGNVKEVDEE